MIPLWTMEILPEVCGCALIWLGAPWVAQRVWAMPHEPLRSAPLQASSRLWILPFSLTTCWPSARTMAMPALSYPRYSSRLSPSSRILAASLVPVTATMPHMGESSCAECRISRPPGRLDCCLDPADQIGRGGLILSLRDDPQHRFGVRGPDVHPPLPAHPFQAVPLVEFARAQGPQSLHQPGALGQFLGRHLGLEHG